MTSRHTGRGRVIEVESLEHFDRLVASGARSMAGWRVQGVDLTGRGPALRRLDPAGALFLGDRMDRADEESVRRRGGLVFPDVPDLPFDPYRSGLYTPTELYAGVEDGYDTTPDAVVYAWSRRAGAHRSPDVADTLSQALHDHAIDDALRGLVTGRRLVGVMGGHAAVRGSETYAAAVRLGRALAGAGLTVCTGGGPGAMEAANLGARAAGTDPDRVDGMLADLAGVPDFRPSVEDWARTAMHVAERLEHGAVSVGIPTWFYGHEPPNVFADHIAKYFRNALRESTLLELCDAGVVFLPGAAGTVQEIFTDACENYYAAPAARAPMVLVGRRYWTEDLPAWPLLRALAERAGMLDRVRLVDDLDEAVAAAG